VIEDSHWIYIAAAYGATFAIVGVVVWRIVGERRRLLRELAQFRSDAGDET
jgi:heme exporter protein CcmD